MRFWSQNGSQNSSQNHPKSIKNQSKTESGLKNVIFWKIAPRLSETFIFEGSGFPKHSQNLQKTVQEPIKNPTKILIEFWIDFLVISEQSWFPKWLQNASKSDLKNVPKIRYKNQWKMMPKLSQKWKGFYSPGASFLKSFSVLVFSSCQGAPRDPKSTIWDPKMNPQSIKLWPRILQLHPKCFHRGSQINDLGSQNESSTFSKLYPKIL